MDQLVSLSGPLGLLTEEIEPDGHALMGNFPQALSHLALISAAICYAEASDSSAGE
jgi:GH15 family glucan-1,4-alpha-glucosidase